MINYLLVKGLEKVKMFYFFVNFNGEVEIVYVQLIQGSKVCKKMFDFDFSIFDIKG